MGRHSDPAERRDWANAETDVGFQKSDRELVSDVYDASSSSPSSHPDEFMALTIARFASLLASVSRQQSEFATRLDRYTLWLIGLTVAIVIPTFALVVIEIIRFFVPGH